MRHKFVLPLFFVFILFIPSLAFAFSIIILSVDNTNTNVEVTFDLGNSPGFPPAVLPKCYYPSQGTQGNPNGVYITVRVINILGSTINNAYLDIRASNNPSSTVNVDQIYWTTTPTSLPPEGTEPQPPWHPFSLNWQNVDVIPVSRQGAEREYRMDMCFKLEGDDEPTPPSGISTLIYVRLYGL